LLGLLLRSGIKNKKILVNLNMSIKELKPGIYSVGTIDWKIKFFLAATFPALI